MPRQFAYILVAIATVLLTGSFGGKAATAQENKSLARGAPPERGSSVCPPHRGSDRPRPTGRDATAAEKAAALAMFQKSPTGRTIAGQFSISMSQAAAKRQNTTRQSYDPSHGNQVSFSTADGRTYLWYPGNAVVLKGEWRACEDRFGLTARGETTMIPFGKVCFKFGPNTFNPVTGVKGDEWECAPASKWESAFVEQRAGDVFGLAKRTAVPFVLPREKTTMEQLLSRMPKQ